MATHKPLSASDTKRWMMCPGSLAWELIREPKVDADTSYSLLGTAAHKIVERCLSKADLYAYRDPGAYFGEEINGVKVDQDMVDATTKMVDYVRSRCVELGIPEKDIRIESKVNPLPHRNDTGGTADVILDAWPYMLEVIDYKHGQGVYVPVQDNPQLRTYALGAMLELGAQDYEVIKYTICQPRHRDAPADGVSSEEISPTELLAFGAELNKHANLVNGAMNRLKAYPSLSLIDLYKSGHINIGSPESDHCRFCDLKSKCPAHYDLAQQMAKIDFSDVDNGPIEVPGNDEQIANIIRWTPRITAFLKAVNEKAEDLMLNQKRQIVGLKVVQKRAIRQWHPDMAPDVIARRLVKDYDVDANGLYTEPKLISGPQAEKLIDKEDKKRFNKEFMVKSDGALTIATVADKRKEVNIDPISDFDGVE